MTINFKKKTEIFPLQDVDVQLCPCGANSVNMYESPRKNRPLYIFGCSNNECSEKGVSSAEIHEALDSWNSLIRGVRNDS